MKLPDIEQHQQQHSYTKSIARTLCRAHICAAALHAALFLSASVSVATNGSQLVSVYEVWPDWNRTRCAFAYGDSTLGICPHSCQPNGNTPSDVRVYGRANMSVILILSQLVTCSMHIWQSYLLYTTSEWYITLSLRGVKLMFWLEYILTASAVAYVVQYYSGIIELRQQLLGVASQSSLMLIGLLLDVLRDSGRAHCAIPLQTPSERFVYRLASCVSFAVGFFSVFVVWLPSVAKLLAGGTGAPSWVGGVVTLEALLYTSFGIAQAVFFAPFLLFGTHVSQTQAVIENLTFIVLSFVSKATLGTAFSICLVYGLCGA